MLKATTVASYFIEQSSTMAENDLTNLKLQKILFYAQAESLNATGKKLFIDDVEAWQYGPVVDFVYQWLKGCGAYPVTTFDVETDTSEASAVKKQFLQEIWDKYSIYSAAHLVKQTHEAGSPWTRFYESGKHATIPLDEVKTAKLQKEWA